MFCLTCGSPAGDGHECDPPGRRVPLAKTAPIFRKLVAALVLADEALAGRDATPGRGRAAVTRALRAIGLSAEDRDFYLLPSSGEVASCSWDEID